MQRKAAGKEEGQRHHDQGVSPTQLRKAPMRFLHQTFEPERLNVDQTGVRQSIFRVLPCLHNEKHST